MKSLSLVNTDNTEISFNEIADAKGFEYPEVSNVIVNVPGRSGKFYISSDYENRVLSWQCLASNVTERRALLGALMGALKTLKFTTCDDLTLQVDVEISRIAMPQKYGRQKCLIQAVAPDYRLLSQELQTVSTQVTVVTGGATLPTELPMAFSNSSGNPSLQVTNNGNAYAEPTFTITGPGTNFVIQNQTTGKSFNINLALNAGETVIVNVRDRTVVKGSTNQYGSFSGDFWELAPGDNEIYFNADSGTDENTLLSIDYRHSYLGV